MPTLLYQMLAVNANSQVNLFVVSVFSVVETNSCCFVFLINTKVINRLHWDISPESKLKTFNIKNIPQ